MKNYACLKKILVILAFGCHALFAQALLTFYFLPPDNDNWIAGNSYLYNGDLDTVESMKIDTARCGWFKKEFRSLSEVPAKALIYLGSQGRDKFDANGIGAELGNPTWLPLRERFGTSSTLYLYLLTDELQFQTTLPSGLGEQEANRCSYKMAAFIYDTDNSVNPSFSGTYVAPTAGNNGLRRGIVAPDLDTATKKPVFIASPGYANWRDAESFNAAFTPKGLYNGKISNIPRCYDMPFGRATNGTWEFDSDRMLTPTTPANLVGGFYPYILDSAYTGLDSDGNRADYADCPTCNKEYTATCFNTMSNTALNNVPALTVPGRGTYTGIDAFDRANDRLPNGWNNAAPYNVYNNATGCTSPRPGLNGASKNRANLSFCFESHAEFIYEKGQEFFFRGDDDIWVFINNRLVIDLGGVHQPVPGYVDLDTIKTPESLVEGKRYPIDIFFCERMATQSNVRVSTNMYIVQKSTFYNNPERIDNWMCANISGGNDCGSKMGMTGGQKIEDMCGPALIEDNNYTVDFYMIRRGTQDTTWLSGIKNPSNCSGDGEIFTCYKTDDSDTTGIKVEKAVYSCGNRGQCQGNTKATKSVNVSGNFTVYARFMTIQGGKPIQVPNSKPLLIDNIKSATNARIVWGTLRSEDGKTRRSLENAYGEPAEIEQSIIAGKRTPIYVAGGRWEDTDSYTIFTYDNDPESVVKIGYSLSGTTGLEITLDSLGEERASFPRSLPPSGIDTLWVRGDFSLGEKEFNINLDGVSNSEDTPSLKLTIYQPVLRFTTDSTFTTFVNPSNPGTASGFLRWTNPDILPPYVGKALDVYVVAWDTLHGHDGLCSHCNFILSETSSTNNESINNTWPEVIVQSDAMRIENGKQIIYIRGRDVVEDTSFAKWRIYGPSKGFTFAEWTDLQFRDAPIPMPLGSEIFDRNGDGIGDSLIIAFGKPFKNDKGEIIDSLLPVLIEVIWEKGYAVPYNNPKHNVDSLKKKDYVMKHYNKDFFKENLEYWKKYLNGDSLIVIAEPNTAFSRNILTSGYNSGKGKLLSYTPFYDQSKCVVGKECGPDAFMYRSDGYEASVFDRIPPIVVKAVYTTKKTKNCGDSKNSACRESLEAYLSEPVFADLDATNDLIKNPFSYCFEYSQHSKCLPEGASVQRNNQAWNNLNWQWELPQAKSAEDTAHSITYKPNNKPSPKKYYDGAIKGDSIIDLVYLAYSLDKGPDAKTTRMPKATDWIKIRPPFSEKDKGGVDVFRDAEGNTANPREIGVLISGTNSYKKEQLKIAVIDKDAKPDDPPLGGIFENGGRKPAWVSDVGAGYANDYLFQPGEVTEFLPIPKGYPIDSAKKYYPSSVGTIFDIATNIKNEVDKVLADCGIIEGKVGICKTKDGRPLTKENIAEGITLHASVYYHTNLGNYTAHRDPVEANCTDKIFRREGGPNDSSNNCYSNEYNFYLAWDLKANSGRFVGSGAYVAITKFYWQMEYIDATVNANGDLNSKKFNQDEFVEMYGVRRGK
jgi:fibro-slime domain-containing protein